MDPPPIMFLPVELLARVLSLLPFKDIVVCSGLSRHFHELVETSTVLQYNIELGKSGLVDSGTGGLNTAERLVLLRKREDAWSSLNWRHSSHIPVGRRYIFWELCGGIFAGSYRSQTDSPYGPRTFDMIDIFELGSRTSDVGPTKTIVLGSRFCNFSVDPGQDLLILVEEPPHMPKFWVMHIRSLSDALAHPRATCGVISIPVAHEAWPSAQNNGPGTVETQILGNAVLYCQRRGPGLSGSISVIDWTTGKMTLTIYPPLGDWYGTLISEKHLLLSQRPAFRSQPCLELYDIHPRSKWHAPRITYVLPFGGDEKWRTKACYAPASYSCTDTSFTGTSRPFVPTRHPLLIAFRFVRSRGVGDTSDPSSSLDMFLIPGKFQTHGQTSGVVEWEKWGPQSTRWFRAALPNKWRRNIQGYRAVLAEKNMVLDFNPHTWAEDEDGVVTQPSHVPSQVPGVNSTISSLPYRTLQPREPFESKNVLLDDQLVCVETDPRELGLVKAFRVLTF